MPAVITGHVQPGKNDASHWLEFFNAAYSSKTEMMIFPGSLNIALGFNFNWFEPLVEAKTIWFVREEYGGERDILLLPCKLRNLQGQRAYLWTPTTAARNRLDPWVVEVITDIKLRDAFGLRDGSVVEIELDL